MSEEDAAKSDKRSRPQSDNDHVYGPEWHAVRTADGFALRWDGGDIVARGDEVSISEAEFERLRHDRKSFEEIADAHNLNRWYTFGKTHYVRGPEPSDEDNVRGFGWTASRVDRGYTLSWLTNDPKVHFMSKEVSCEISEAEFERLRREPEAFAEIAFKHDPIHAPAIL